jgi:alpha-tubulin suppressor-like RCC1 family protein
MVPPKCDTCLPKYVVLYPIISYTSLVSCMPTFFSFSGTGRIVSWGWNEHGNCGTGTEEDVRVPTSVGMSINQKAVIAGTGAGHSFALYL